MEQKKQPVGRCEDCEFYDYDEELDAYVCDVSLDEDEMVSFMSGNTGRCPTSAFTMNTKVFTNRFDVKQNTAIEAVFICHDLSDIFRTPRTGNIPRNLATARRIRPARTTQCGGKSRFAREAP